MKNLSTLELLTKLVSINSIFPREQEVSTFVAKYLVQIGFEVKTVTTGKNRNNIVATYGKSNSYLAFYAHLDTVPIAHNWKRDPFKLIVKAGKAYGLGSGDVKNGLSAIIKTGEYAVKNKLPMMLVITVDEENISQGAHDTIDSKLLKKVGLLVSSESGQIKDYSAKYSVIYGRLGRAVFDIVVDGQTAHAAEAERGINAIHQASKLIQQIEIMPIPSDSKLGKARLLLQSIHADTNAYSVPDMCVIQYSLLSNSKLDQPQFINNVKKIMKNMAIKGSISIHSRPTPYGESYILNANLPYIKQIQSQIFMKDSVIPAYAQSVGDENIFANRLKIPVIVVGPMRDNAHKANEWVDLVSLDKVIEVYKRMLDLYTAS